MKRSTYSTASLALAAFGSLAVFPLIVVVLHVVQANHYHPMRDAVSELALGRAGWLMTIAFCASAIGTLLIALTLRRLPARPRVAPGLLALAGCLGFFSAFVHADPSTDTATTTHGQVHQLAGIATFILIIAAMFLLVRTFRSDPAWRPLATPTRAWAFAAVAAFFLIPLSGKAYFGLAQRAFIATCFGWMLAIALYAHRAERQATTTPEPARDPHVVHDAEIRPGAPDLSAT